MQFHLVLILLKMYAAFYLGFCLDSFFEILDLTTDDPHLQTVPQRIGVKKTKIVGLSLLLRFIFRVFKE
jgi:hypothetical protein